MFKLAGLLGLVVCCGLLGLAKARRLRTRIFLLEDFLKVTLEIKGQINYFREPLPDIFRKLGKNGDSAGLSLLAAVFDDLEAKDGDIVEIWPQKVDERYAGTALTPKDVELFKYPGQFLGQTDFVNHLWHFEYLETHLRQQIEEARRDYDKKGPLYSHLGFFLGAIGAIIFI